MRRRFISTNSAKCGGGGALPSDCLWGLDAPLPPPFVFPPAVDFSSDEVLNFDADEDEETDPKACARARSRSACERRSSHVLRSRCRSASSSLILRSSSCTRFWNASRSRSARAAASSAVFCWRLTCTTFRQYFYKYIKSYHPLQRNIKLTPANLSFKICTFVLPASELFVQMLELGISLLISTSSGCRSSFSGFTQSIAFNFAISKSGSDTL